MIPQDVYFDLVDDRAGFTLIRPSLTDPNSSKGHLQGRSYSPNDSIMLQTTYTDFEFCISVTKPLTHCVTNSILHE